MPIQFINHTPLSNCYHAEVYMENVGEEDDPIREIFCGKCKKICDIYDKESHNAKE